MVIMSRLSLTARLVVMSLIMIFVSVIVVASLSVYSARSALRESRYQALQQTLSDRKKTILTHLQRCIAELESEAASANTGLAQAKLMDCAGGGLVGNGQVMNTASDSYRSAYDIVLPYYRTKQAKLGYDNLMILCAAHGHIVFQSVRQKDLGACMSTPANRNSALARLHAQVVKTKRPVLMDFSYYEPARTTCMFAGVPAMSGEGQLTAVLVAQLGARFINDAMALDMEQAEAYLVGSDGLMRSDSRFESESTVLKKKIDTVAVSSALRGKTGVIEQKSYRGIDVLAAYDRLGLNRAEDGRAFTADFDWSIVAEVDADVAFSVVRTLINRTITVSLIVALLAAAAAVLVGRLVARPIKGVADQLAAAAAEISVSASQLSANATQTATAVHETTATVEEVRQTTIMASERARNMSETAKATVDVSRTGLKSVEEASEGMSQIRKQVGFIAESIVRLSEQSQAIGDIISTVDDIAEQSNLLAVNASIEAAKAGEQGRGFAVVAREIKALAEQSKHATQQVRVILNDVQKATSAAVMATEQGGKAVDAGLRQSAQAGDAIRALSDSIEVAAQTAMQIAASSKQQAAGVEQVTMAMESINQASGQNVTSARQLEEASVILQEMGTTLRVLIEPEKEKGHTA